MRLSHVIAENLACLAEAKAIGMDPSATEKDLARAALLTRVADQYHAMVQLCWPKKPTKLTDQLAVEAEKVAADALRDEGATSPGQ